MQLVPYESTKEASFECNVTQYRGLCLNLNVKVVLKTFLE